MQTSFISQRIFGLETTLYGVIPAHSQILSVIVESFNSKTGSVTLQTETKDGGLAGRILYLDDITAAGIYSGDSAKNYFVSRQNMNVKIIGSLEIQIKILFWEAS